MSEIKDNFVTSVPELFFNLFFSFINADMDIYYNVIKTTLLCSKFKGEISDVTSKYEGLPW